jgi:hypothetical protein
MYLPKQAQAGLGTTKWASRTSFRARLYFLREEVATTTK